MHLIIICSASHPVQQPESSLPSARIVELEKVIASAAQDCVQSYNNLTNVVTGMFHFI